MKLRAVFLLGFISVCAYGQAPTCENIRTAKTQTYGFHPPQLTDSARTQKSKQMDQFWKLVEAAGPDDTACLRNLIAIESTDHYFQFDASSLLLKLDPSPVSLEIIVPAVQKADFQDVTLPDIFRSHSASRKRALTSAPSPTNSSALQKPALTFPTCPAIGP